MGLDVSECVKICHNIPEYVCSIGPGGGTQYPSGKGPKRRRYDVSDCKELSWQADDGTVQLPCVKNFHVNLRTV